MVEEYDQLPALRMRAGVEAALPDLAEFMDTVQAEIKMDPGGEKGHTVLKMDTNLRVWLKNHGGFQEKKSCN